MPRMVSANEMLSKCSLSLTVAVSCEYCELKSRLLSVATPHTVSVSRQSHPPAIAGKNLGATTVMVTVPVWGVSMKSEENPFGALYGPHFQAYPSDMSKSRIIPDPGFSFLEGAAVLGYDAIPPRGTRVPGMEPNVSHV